MSAQFDLFKGKAERDHGMALVRDHNEEFSYQFYHFVLSIPSGWVGQCEDIRKVWTGVQPKHPNAWGSCWGQAKKKGLLVELPQKEAMTAVKSHSRKTHLHKRT